MHTFFSAISTLLFADQLLPFLVNHFNDSPTIHSSSVYEILRIIIISKTVTRLSFYKYVCFGGSENEDRRDGAFSSNHI